MLKETQTETQLTEVVVVGWVGRRKAQLVVSH